MVGFRGAQPNPTYTAISKVGNHAILSRFIPAPVEAFP